MIPAAQLTTGLGLWDTPTAGVFNHPRLLFGQVPFFLLGTYRAGGLDGSELYLLG